MRRAKLRAVALAALLLTTAIVPGGPVGTAVAAEQGNCSSLDDFVMFVTLGLVNAEDCSRQAYVDDAVQDMKELDQNQTKVDLHSSAIDQKAGEEAWAAPFDNYLQDTQSTAWMKAQVAVAEAYENGSTKSEAKKKARQAIEDYYSAKAVNLIEQWNTTVDAHDTYHNVSQQEGFGGYDQNGNWGKDQYVWFNGNHTKTRYDGLVTRTVALPNGTAHGVKTFEVYDGADSEYRYINVSTGTQKMLSGHELWSLRVEAPDSSYDSVNYTYFEDYERRWDEIHSQTSNLKSESDNFVEATWDDFVAGEINASDVISSHTAMFEYGVRSANESEGLYQSTAALAMMGYDTPNMSSSGLMNVTYNGTTYSGLVLAKNAPGGQWETGTTYNTSNIDGPVFMATESGHKVDFGEGETFVIEEMTAKDGTTIKTQNTTKYVYKTSNTTELLEVKQQLLELRQEIEEEESAVGGGGDTDSSGFSFPDLGTKQLIALAVAAAAIIGLRQ